MELTDQDRKLIADTVLRDGRLPLEMRELLFPEERREATLSYSGKSRKEDVIADTMAVPLQPLRTFGVSRSAAGDGWSNSLIFGDNLQALKTLLQQKRAGQLRNAHGEPGVQLIYIDPPFASSRDFGAKKGEVAYQDKVVGTEFLEFFRRRLILLRELLSETGSIFVHLDSKKGHYAKVILDEIFGEENFRNEIVWHYYNKMQGNVKRFASNHDVIFWYSKSSTYTFNVQQEDRETPVRQIRRIWDKEGKKLVNAKGPDGKVLYQDSVVKTVDDVWRLSMLQPADRSQNMNYPTQKPEALAARIIEAASNSGDIVLDAFAGSGTALAVAEKLERRWIGIDCGKLAIYTIQKRLLTLKQQIGNRGKALQPMPFTLYNAGLYDFSSLNALPWEDWRFFGLTLFECQDTPHQVSGVDFDGYRHGSDVIVFDHRQAGGVILDRGYIEDLHRNLGNSAGETTYVVAPAASVAFFEDYIDIDDSRYYILRIPYSIINELHRRPFVALRQPLSEEAVNRTMDSVGFDFMKKPRVSCTYAAETSGGSQSLTIRIDEFWSEALAKGLAATGNRETLAAVLLDFDYPEGDGDQAPPFVLDQVHYASELATNDWTIRIPAKSLGDRVMIIYLDVYGNEYTELKQTFELLEEDDSGSSGAVLAGTSIMEEV